MDNPSSTPELPAPPVAALPPPTPPPLSAIPAPPSPARRSRRGIWLGVLAAVAVAFVLLFTAAPLLLHLLGVGSTADGGGPRFVEVTLEDNDAHDKIAVLHVEGVISGEAVDGVGLDLPRMIKLQLKHAAEDDRVKAVVLRINSPGGEVLASDEIYQSVHEFQKKTGKPVVASMGSLAASGGYYVAAPCQWIVAHELTITGSIGVIFHGYNYRGLMNKIGLKPQVYKSGRFKDMLSGDRDMDSKDAEDLKIMEEERQMVQGLINETYQRFRDVVQAGRDRAAEKNRSAGHKLAPEWTSLADGRILTGKQALENGFVDQLGDFEAATTQAAKLAGINQANLVEYQVPFELSQIFRLFGKTEKTAIQLDLGMNLPKLKAGRLYFLSPAILY